MKVKLLAISLFFVTCINFLSYSQPLKSNLKNLDKISVQVFDEEHLLTEKITQKLTTEIKLKLMSSGMKVLSPEESSANMCLYVNAIKSRFSEHRILVQIHIMEDVITSRRNSIKTNAITYSDYSFFTSKFLEEAVYDKIMDTMIINFIEKYLKDNQNS